MLVVEVGLKVQTSLTGFIAHTFCANFPHISCFVEHRFCQVLGFNIAPGRVNSTFIAIVVVVVVITVIVVVVWGFRALTNMVRSATAKAFDGRTGKTRGL
jgi:uncharacterized membrane protein YdbT with pleckstrin-like domain